MKRLLVVAMCVMLGVLGAVAVSVTAADRIKCCHRGKCLDTKTVDECTKQGGKIVDDCRACR
jgi:hypothetical protein